MYNVKILKYPTGWQYRIYSRPVGFCLDKDFSESDVSPDTVYVWNESIKDYEETRCKLSDCWENPFTGEFEKMPPIVSDTDRERSAKVSMNRTINRVYHLARSNIWDWFITLTFNPEKVNRYDYDICVKKLKNWLDIVRRSCPDFRYIIVPEKHKDGAFHFHGLIADCDGLNFVETSLFDESGRRIYNIGKYKLGWTTATQVADNEKVTKYLSKYITKDVCSVSFGKKRYWCSRNLAECEVEELLLEEPEAQLLHVMSKAKYIKVVDGAEITTTYIEMGCCDV